MSRVHQGALEDPLAIERLADAKRRLGAAARRRRKALELTQEQVAEQLDCSTSYYQTIEYGQANTSIRMIAHLSVVFSCEIADLFGPIDRARRTSLKKAAN